MDYNMNDELYTVAEAAGILKTNRNYVYALIKAGILPALKLGCYKVRKNSIQSFLDNYSGMDLSDLNNIKPITCR